MGWGGHGSWTYSNMNDAQINEELLRVATTGSEGNIDFASMQPCTSYDARTMDRFCVRRWNLSGGRWSFTSVFDGTSHNLQIARSSSEMLLGSGLIPSISTLPVE